MKAQESIQEFCVQERMTDVEGNHFKMGVDDWDIIGQGVDDWDIIGHDWDIIGQYLAVPATSASPERFFSRVGLVQTDLRGSLLDTTMIDLMWAKQPP